MAKTTDYELLSAYLDDELSPAERARAEELLAASADARRMLDELRSLASTLHSLPPQKLPEDLSEKVLQAAALRKATPGEPARSSEPARPRITRRQIAERLSNPRLILWPAIIITVAVLLVVFSPDQNGGNRQVAQNPANKNIADANNAQPKAAHDAGPKETPSISALPPSNSSHLVIKGNPGDAKNSQPTNPKANVTVIECRVARDVFDKQEFRKLFEAGDLALSDKSAADVFGMTPAELAEATGVEQSVLETANTADANSAVKAVAVEITPAQFAGIIDRLYSSAGAYRDISIKPPAAPPGVKSSSLKRVLVVFRAEE